MLFPAEISLNSIPLSGPTLLLGLGGIGLYIAARFGTRALVGPRGYATASAGMVALGHWVPTAAVAVTAVLLGRPDIGLGVAFATSVAALSLAIGMVTFLVPAEPLPETRRLWTFLLPASLLPLLGGFSGSLNVLHGVMLAVLGLFVGLVWRALEREPETVGEMLNKIDAHQTTDSADGRAVSPAARSQFPWLRATEWALAVALAIVAAEAVVRGAIRTDDTSKMFRATLLSAGAISPLLVLPLLAAGTDLAQRNRSGEACSACVVMALLNLLVLLPALIGIWCYQQAMAGHVPAVVAPVSTHMGILDLIGANFQRLPSIPLPITVWRIDSVVLTVFSIGLLPVSIGRWRIGRLEAIGLILAYAAYLAATAVLAVRPGGV